MIPELLAIGSAILLAIQITVSRKGLLTLTVTSGLMINLSVATVTLWLFAIIFFPTQNIDSTAILFFVLGGAIGPFLGRLFLFDGLRRLGAALASTINGIYPLFASLIAIIFLGEKITLFIFLGTVSITLGVGIISWSKSGSQWKFRKVYLIIPILASLCFGFSDSIMKFGLGLMDFPILGAAVMSTTALASLTLFLICKGELSLPIREEGSIYLVISGLITSFFVMAFFSALSFGTVVIVSPLAGTAPLFVLLFSRLFLKGIEKVTLYLVIGAIVITFGSTLVAIG